MSIASTWKPCKDQGLLKVYEEVCQEARNLGYIFTTPTLYLIKSSRCWGKCHYEVNPKKEYIALNEVFLQKPELSRNTLIHELAHALTVGDHHGNKWRTAGNKIGAKWNINVERTNEYEGVSLHSNDKYLIKCPKCGTEYPRSRMSDLVKHPSDYRCGHCNTTLVRVK